MNDVMPSKWWWAKVVLLAIAWPALVLLALVLS
jgi:hypothetical protein